MFSHVLRRAITITVASVSALLVYIDGRVATEIIRASSELTALRATRSVEIDTDGMLSAFRLLVPATPRSGVALIVTTSEACDACERAIDSWRVFGQRAGLEVVTADLSQPAHATRDDALGASRRDVFAVRFGLSGLPVGVVVAADGRTACVVRGVPTVDDLEPCAHRAPTDPIAMLTFGHSQ